LLEEFSQELIDFIEARKILCWVLFTKRQINIVKFINAHKKIGVADPDPDLDWQK
jgi:hypothetical protein